MSLRFAPIPLNGTGPFKKIALIGPFVDSRTYKDYMSFWTLGIGAGAHDYDSTKIVTPAQALKPALEKLGYEVTYTTVCLDALCSETAMSAALNASKLADVVIVCVGERGMDCGESRSVSSLVLNGQQEKLVQICARGNKPTVLCLFNSRPLVFPVAAAESEAILVAWQPGYETGNALADVLTGAHNPSGKLPMTFPRTLGQVPVYYNQLNTGRPQEKFGTLWTSGYLDASTEPAWPFGFGLSYTNFSYTNLTVSDPTMRRDGTQQISVTITNTGNVRGEETVQLYTRDITADIARPVKELKGFQKIMLNAGESRDLRFTLTANDLAYWNNDLKWKADPGKFKVFVGGDSKNVKETEFVLE